MMNQWIIPVSICLPLLAGAALPFLKKTTKTVRSGVIVAALVLEAVAVTAAMLADSGEFVLFSMTEKLTVAFSIDGTAKIFMAIAGYGYLLAGLFSLRYFRIENEKEPVENGRMCGFYAFYLLSESALVGMDLSKNLVTMYLFFEMITLSSMPLVLHDRTGESIRAALKYLFYSIAGAFLALLAIFFLARFSTTMDFTPGGNLDPAAVSGHENLLRIAVFLGVIGFGAKAGMYPLHGWLPTAHPVAPAPASAVLSGIIAKAGVLAILRVVYFSVGTAFLANTWVQYAWLSLALLTVFMGSMMAFREKVFKKRLAYSSVSNISYVLTGLFLMTPTGLGGGLLHVIFHATIKICLFLIAGVFIAVKGAHHVEEFRGYGKSMPVTLWCFTLAALSLIGIPPFAGFVSKWYLAVGALDAGLPVFSWLAPTVLLISALLTAGYLLPITIDGFFPGKDFKAPARCDEGGPKMWLPILVLGAMTLLLGLLAGLFVPAIFEISGAAF